jgi:tRNA pseudouridine38-40 synthase
VLVEIGKGNLETMAAGRLLTSASDTPARLTAPASGLFLEKVYYENDEKLGQTRTAAEIWNSRILSPEP